MHIMRNKSFWFFVRKASLFTLKPGCKVSDFVKMSGKNISFVRSDL